MQPPREPDTALLEKLRAPFGKGDVDTRPQPMAKDDKDRGICAKGSKYSADGTFCGGYHARSIHLSYVGHAALTQRLLEVDPLWEWEPIAFDTDGNPKPDADGGLWIRLSVAGMVRLGYGSADGKRGGNATKEIIGDALRNAGMRFGMALELWRKGDQTAAQESRGTQPTPEVGIPEPIVAEWIESLTGADTLQKLGLLWAEAGRLGVTRDARVVKAKDARKAALNKAGDA